MLIYINLMSYSTKILSSILFLQVAIEGLMQTLRCVLLATFVFMWPSQAVILYGVSHLFGSFAYIACYYILFAWVIHRKREVEKLPVHSFRQLFPTWERGKWMVSIG